MKISITATHEGGGGHTRFDYEITPKTGREQSEILRRGIELEKTISTKVPSNQLKALIG
ncbi:MAG: hypothetical protein AABN33_22205 [Acidobacteriota bacterium]